MVRSHRFLFLSLLLLVVAGCQEPLRLGLLRDASVHYERGEYDQAYTAASTVAQRGEAWEYDEASLIAGLAARQRGDLANAEQYLRQAANSRDPAIAGDALASLGLLYAQQERYQASANALQQAAEFLEGQPRANAYFYAAVAQQKLGRWAQARTNLVLARSASGDAEFIEQVNDQLAVVGWTLQLGAFRDQDNAQATVEQLTAQTREAQIGTPRILETTDRDGNALAVVQVGQFTTFQSASRARDRLGVNSAIIIPLAGR